MNITEIQKYATHLQAVTSKGAEALSAIEEFANTKLRGHVTVIEKTPGHLDLSFYGLILRFRVEMSWQTDRVNQQIVVYVRSAGDPNGQFQPTGIAHHFDHMGNFDGRYTLEEYRDSVLCHVLSKFNEVGCKLFP